MHIEAPQKELNTNVKRETAAITINTWARKIDRHLSFEKGAAIARSMGIAIVVVIIVIAAAAGALLLVPKSSTATTSTTPAVSQSSPSTSSSIVTSMTSSSVVSSTSSSTQTPASTTASALISSSSQITTSSASTSSTLSSGNAQATLSVNKTITDPPESSSSQLVYIYDFVVVDNNVQDLEVGLFDFQLVGTSTSVYHSVTALAEVILNSVQLNAGQKAEGQISFLIPRTDTPSSLEFMSGAVDVSDSNLPAASANVSDILNFDGNLTGSAASNASISIIQPENFTEVTSQGYYYSGDVIAVNISLGFSLQYSGNGSDTYTVNSITDTSGLQILSFSPDLPVSFGSSGVHITVYLLAPGESFRGTVFFVINVS
jgi:hypothetical protein